MGYRRPISFNFRGSNGIDDDFSVTVRQPPRILPVQYWQRVASISCHPSWLATLFLSSSLKTANPCETMVFYIPTQIQAYNLGYGAWILTSATDTNDMREYSLQEQRKLCIPLIPFAKFV